MQRYFILSLILLALILEFGCSGKSANTNANATAIPAETLTSADAALAEGKRLFDENQTEAAIVSLEKAVELNPDLAEAHFYLGIAYDLLDLQKEQSGEVTGATGDERKKSRSEKAFERAVTAYKKMLAANPKDDMGQFNLGRTYSKLNRDEEAVDAFEKAVELKPDDTEYLTELGATQMKLARYHEAIKSLKKAIELDEGNGRAIEMLEDAEAGRQRVTYKDKGNANLANKAVNSNSATSNSNSAPSTNGAIKPPPRTPDRVPSPLPAITPRDQSRGRLPNPETRPRKVN